MRRLVSLMGLCTLLVGISVIGGRAQTISIVNDGEMMMDVNLRDADVSEVLTALFNTTNGKYQLRLGNGVVGRVNRLQFAGVTFDNALNTILDRAGGFSIIKEAGTGGTVIYNISGRQTTAPTPATPITPVMAPPTTETKTASNSAANTPPSGFLSYVSKSSTSTDPTKAGTTSGGAAGENEISVIKLVGINYIDIQSFTDALGFSTIDLFVMNSDGSTSGGGTGYNNNNNNNNNGYNNNNNNNGLSNSRSSRLNNNNSNTNTNTRTSTRTNNRTTTY